MKHNYQNTSPQSIFGVSKTFRNGMFLCFFLLMSFLGSATNYYVAPTSSPPSGWSVGLDSNSGLSKSLPKATVQSVLNTYGLTSSDVIYIAAGNYSEAGIFPTNDDSGFTIQGDVLSGGVPTTIFTSNNNSGRWLTLGSDSATASVNDNITINNIYVKNYTSNVTVNGLSPGNGFGGGGVLIRNSVTGTTINYCVFDNCTTQTTSTSTVQYGGAIHAVDYFVVTNTVFKNCSSYQDAGAIGLFPTADASYYSAGTGTPSVVDRCTFFNNTSGTGTPGDGSAISNGVLSGVVLIVKNSLFYNNAAGPVNGGNGVIVSKNGTVVNVMNCTVTKNTVKSGAGTGGIYTVSSTMYVVNTISVNNTGASGIQDIKSSSSTLNVANSFYTFGGSISNSTGNTSNVTAPGFTNEATNDYTLTSSSICVNQGTPTALSSYGNITPPTYDIRNIARVGNPDVGAYESVTGPTITASAASLNAFSTCGGTNSTEQNFNVSGLNLTDNITVTAPTGFEVSLTTATGFGSSVTLTQTSGSVSNASVFVRTATSASGTPSGNITLASTGATTQNVAASASITPTPSSIVLSDNTVVGAGTVYQGSAKNIISRFKVNPTGAAAVLNTLTFTTTGTALITADLTNLRLYYSATNTFSTATQISELTTGLSAGSHTFTGLTQSIADGATGYFWITTQFTTAATNARTIAVSANPTLTFQCGSTSGSISASGTQTISTALATYYSNNATANTEATVLTNWNSARDGSGFEPATFLKAAIFKIQPTHRYQVGAAWTGTATSDVYVEDGGALDVNGANAATIATWQRFYLAGNGVDVSGVLTGALYNSSATAASFGRPITLTAAAKISSYTGTGGLTVATGLAVNFNNNTFLLTLDGSNTLTISGAISGSGGLTKKGTGTVILSGANSFTGTVSLDEGTVRNTSTGAISANGAFGNSSSAIQLNGAALEVNFGTFTRPISVTANGSRIDAYGAARAALAIPISATGNYTLQLGGTTNGALEGQAMTLTGVISNGSGTLSLEKVRTSTLTLSGATNSFTGTTTISNGILKLGATGTSPNGPLGTVDGGTIVNSGGTLDLVSFVLATNEPLTLNGTGSTTTNGALTNTTAATFNGPITLSGDALIYTTGSITLTGNINNGGYNLTADGPLAKVLTLSGNISGTGGIIKNGAGTTHALTLSGNNTYSGTTTLTTGTLNINSTTALGTGTFSIGAGTIINNSTASAIGLTTNNPITINGDFTFTGTKNIDFGTGNVTLTDNAKITYSTASTTLKFAGGFSNTTSGVLGNYLLARVGTTPTLDIPGRATLASWALTANANGTASGGTATAFSATGLSAIAYGATGASTTTHPTTVSTGTKYYEFIYTPTQASATVTHVMFDYSTSASTATTQLYYINNTGALTAFNATSIPSITTTTTNRMYADLTSSPILVAVNTPIKFRLYSTETASGNAFRVANFTIMGAAPSFVLTNDTGISIANCAGTASAERGIGVTASNLVGNLVVTPPTGFEISATSGGSFSSSISLTPVGAAINQNVYIRLAAATAAGSYSGTVSFVSSNASTNSASISGTVAATIVAGSATPAASSVCTGTGTSISVSGYTGTTFQWQQSTNNVDWSSVTGGSGGTTDTYTTPNLTTATYYRVGIGNASCTTLYTTGVLITVNPTTVGGTLSGGATVCATSNSTNLTLSGQTGSVTKWQYSSDNFSSDVNDVSNTTSTLTATNLTATTYYRAVVQSGACSATYSDVATITVNPAAAGGSISGGTNVCTGTNSFTLTLSGYSGSITKWQYSTVSDFSSVNDVSNITSTLSFSGTITGTRYYRAVISSGVCSNVNSSSATITVNPTTVKGNISGSATVCSGTNSTTLTLSGNVGDVIRWESASNSGFTIDYQSISNTTTTLDATDLTGTTFYRAVVQSGACSQLTTNPAVVTVNPEAVGGTMSSSTTICNGETADLSLSGYTGTAVWQSAHDVDFTVDLSDVTAFVTSDSYTTNSLSETTYYRAVLSSGVCANAYSNVVTVTVTPVASGGSISGGTSVCYGTNSTNLTLSSQVGDVSKWQYSSDDFVSDVHDVANTTTTLTATNLTATTYYRAVIASGSCSTANSEVATINVDALPVGGTISGDASYCSSTNSTTFTLSSYSGTISKWQSASSSDFSTGLSDITNTTNTLVATNRSATTYYRALIVNGSCSAVYSTTGTVTITPASVGGVVSSNQTVCTGSSPASLTLSDYSGTILRWESSLNSSFTSPTTIANTTSTLSGTTIGNLTQTTYFRAVIQSGVCVVNSSYVTLSVISTTWNGTAWSNGAPDINTTAFITGNYSLSVDIAACTLTVSNNAVVSIPSGYDVHLQGLLTVNTGSTFTVYNNSNLIQDNQVTNIGKIVVKRNAPSLYRLDYVLWSSPVASGSTQKLSDFSPKTALTRFYTYTPASNFWTSVADPKATTFTTGKGVLIRMPNDWIAYGAGSSAVFTGSFTGVPNNGTYTVSITDGARTSGADIIHGYNSVGNPYPSTVDISDFINANTNSIDGTLWLWRKTNDQTNPVSYSTCTTTACTVNNGHSYHSDDNYISVGQGFLVRSKVGASSITFNNSMRRSQNIDQFFRVNERDRYWLDVKNASGTPYSQVAFAYIPDATLGFDEAKDGEYINDAPTVFSCMVDGKETVIQARPSFDSNDVVNMQFRTDAADNYEISINKMEGIFPNQDIYIKDNLLGVEHNLKSGPYTFASEVGTFANRFEMRYQPALDVEKPDFTANQVVVYKNNNMIHVNSGIQDMATIKIYDVRGRLILTKSNVNSTNFAISADDFAKEVLLFEITSSTGIKVTKKVVN